MKQTIIMFLLGAATAISISSMQVPPKSTVAFYVRGGEKAETMVNEYLKKGYKVEKWDLEDDQSGGEEWLHNAIVMVKY